MSYKYPLDGPVYDLESGPAPFDHLEPEIELNAADIAEIIKDDITDRVELYPEYAKLIQEASKEGVIHALGASMDAAIIEGIDQAKAVSIMNKAIEILKERKLY